VSRRAKLNRSPVWTDPYKAEVIKSLQQFSIRHNPFKVFCDFIEMSALALSNKFDLINYDRREKRYMEVIKNYKKEELDLFAKTLGQLQACYQARLALLGDAGLRESVDNIGDVLGQIFMALDLGNDRAGQFFTPYEVSLMMAKMVTVGDGSDIRKRGFITMDEPACGSAGMVVAVAQAMHEAGLNYPTMLHATCTDVDPTCVHMAYVQLTLLGIPATVVHGNSLTLQTWDVWHTPAHYLCGWPNRFEKRRIGEACSKMIELMRSTETPKQPQPEPVAQAA
jgi:hypothetical protein